MKVIKKDSSAISVCAELLVQGKILILPTDTVYGFSGIIGSTEQKIREIKGRGDEKPFIILIGEPEDVYSITDVQIPESLFSLWPGPLTIIVPKKNSSETIAVRCPGDQWLRSIITLSGNPIYSTSVNRSGSQVISLIGDMQREFGNEVDLLVDDGDCKSTAASTIVSITDENIKVVRQGAVIIPGSVLK